MAPNSPKPSQKPQDARQSAPTHGTPKATNVPQDQSKGKKRRQRALPKNHHLNRAPQVPQRAARDRNEPDPTGGEGAALARTILDTNSGKRTTIKLIMQEMEECGAKSINLPERLMNAVPIIADELMHGSPRVAEDTKTGIPAQEPKPPTRRSKSTGAKLVLAAARYNLDRFEEANKTDVIKVEHQGEIGTFIIPAPVIGKLGDAPKPRQ